MSKNKFGANLNSLKIKKTIAVSMVFIFSFTQLSFASLLQKHAFTRDQFLKNSPPLFLIQDIHNHTEAQNQITQTLKILYKKNKGNLKVGVEGASGWFRYEKFQSLPNQDRVKKIGERFLEEGLISGSELFGLMEKKSSLIGIEERELYLSHIKSYQVAIDLKEKIEQDLLKIEEELEKKKNRLFSTQLKDLDRLSTGFHAGVVPMSSYLKTLSKYVSETDFDIDLFLSAKKLEGEIDFKRADLERKAFIREITPNFNEPIQLNQTHSLYQSLNNLMRLAEDQKWIKGSYKNLKDYVQYLGLVENINSEKLSKKARFLEGKAYRKLTKQTPVLAKIVKESQWLRLGKKLISFSLTPLEWEQYKKVSKNHATLNLSEFEAFYHIAEKRNISIFRNILKDHVDVLVLGGFHSFGIKKILKDNQKPFKVLRPRISDIKMDKSQHYLSAFAQKKTPLEKLFSKWRLFLSLPPSLGVEPLYDIDSRNNLDEKFLRQYQEEEQDSGLFKRVINYLTDPTVREVVYILPLAIGLITNSLPLIMIGLVTHVLIYPLRHRNDGKLINRILISLVFTDFFLASEFIISNLTGGTSLVSLIGGGLTWILFHKINNYSVHNPNSQISKVWRLFMPIEPVLMVIEALDFSKTKKSLYVKMAKSSNQAIGRINRLLSLVANNIEGIVSVDSFEVNRYQEDREIATYVRERLETKNPKKDGSYNFSNDDIPIITQEVIRGIADFYANFFSFGNYTKRGTEGIVTDVADFLISDKISSFQIEHLTHIMLHRGFNEKPTSKGEPNLFF